LTSFEGDLLRVEGKEAEAKKKFKEALEIEE
jgi:predicted negative regulator of RcsB-dependent stress response